VMPLTVRFASRNQFFNPNGGADALSFHQAVPVF